MILNENYGNLQQLSDIVMDSLKQCCSNLLDMKSESMIGKDSKVIIVNNDDIDDIISKDFKKIAFIVIRYKIKDLFLCVHLKNTDEDLKTYALIDDPFYYDRFINIKNFLKEIKDLYDKFLANKISYDKFTKNINYQIVYYDEIRIKKFKNRYDLIHDSNLEKSRNDTYWKNGMRYKVHGSLKDDRNNDWFRHELKKRLKAYVESKFPNFNNIEELENANIKSFMKSFKINGFIYNYDQTDTTNFIRAVFSAKDPLYSLLNNKKSYLIYVCDDENKNLPMQIIFEVILDVNNNIKVKNIYGYNGRINNIRQLIPIGDFMNQDNDNQTTDYDDNDDNDDW